MLSNARSSGKDAYPLRKDTSDFLLLCFVSWSYAGTAFGLRPLYFVGTGLSLSASDGDITGSSYSLRCVLSAGVLDTREAVDVFFFPGLLC